MGIKKPSGTVLKRLVINHILVRLLGVASLLITPVILFLSVIEACAHGWDLGEEAEDIYDYIEQAIHKIAFGGSQ